MTDKEKPMKTMVVYATDLPFQDVEVDPTEFSEWCRSIVGGWFQVIHLPGPNIDMWMDEEGNYKGYESNEWATAAAFWGKAGLAPTDFVMGNVVLTGGADGEGRTQGLTDEQLLWLREKVVI